MSEIRLIGSILRKPFNFPSVALHKGAQTLRALAVMVYGAETLLLTKPFKEKFWLVQCAMERNIRDVSLMCQEKSV